MRESDPVNAIMLEHTHCTIGFGCQEEVEMMDWDRIDRANDGRQLMCIIFTRTQCPYPFVHLPELIDSLRRHMLRANV